MKGSGYKIAGLNAVAVVVYFLLGKLGLSLAFVHTSTTAVWPPSGIAIAGVLLLGRKVLPGIWLGAFLVNYVTCGVLLPSAGIATGNALEAYVGAWLVWRFANGLEVFRHATGIFKFIVLAGGLATMISAGVGVASLYFGGLAEREILGAIAVTWWIGDMVSVLVLTPLVILTVQRPVLVINPNQRAELFLLFGFVGLIGTVLFGGWVIPRNYPLEYFALPPLLWGAYRFGQQGAAYVSFAMACLAVAGTAAGFGPFVVGNPNESLLLLQMFLGTIAGTALVFGAVIWERRRAEYSLRVQYAVGQVLADAGSVETAARDVLAAIGESTGWQAGGIWVLRQAEGSLTCLQFWSSADRRIEPFESESRTRQFQKGEGLPGRIWKTEKAWWIADLGKDSNFPRARAAYQSGLRSAVGVPIRLGEEFFGVIEFFGAEVRAVDFELLQLMEAIGTQVGQFVQRSKAQEALREQHNLLRAIIEGTTDAIFVKDRQGRYIMMNSACSALFEKPESELLGKTDLELFPEAIAQHIKACDEKVLSTGRIQTFEDVIAIPGGKRVFQSNKGIYKNHAGEVIGLVGIAREITELKRAEEAVQNLNRELGRRVQMRTAALQESHEQMEAFVYSISHDLRAPLRAMMSFSQALLNDYSQVLDEAGQDFAQRIVLAAERMDCLIQDLLAYSRLTRSELEFTDVSLEQVTRKVLASLGDEIRARKVLVEVAESLPVVRGHQVTLEQVVFNLVANAMKFVAPGTQPRVRISSVTQGDLVRYIVEDNGIGIDRAHHERIFRVFERLHGSESYPGTGVGLAIVRKGVERMGGRAGVESAPGAGSRFWFELPRGEEHDLERDDKKGKGNLAQFLM